MSRLRIVTYNVHRCLGVDGRLSPGRIAEVIAETKADVVALQELDVRRVRSGGIDQAEAVARELGMGNVHFHPALKVMEEEYGDAIITALPSKVIKASALPGLERQPRIEPRSAIWAQIEVDGGAINVINTHFGLRRWERRAQARCLLGPEWLGHADPAVPLVLAGDFNSFPHGTVCGMIRRHLRDAHQLGSPKRRRPRRTYPSGFPVFRIDHIFVSSHFSVPSADTHRSVLSRAASDHLPLVAELVIDRQIAAEPVSRGGDFVRSPPDRLTR
ncbi:endonuclease/exonuclease/phosphatase family protein [Aquibium sp. ELW1220]|uniref:endonuclease/exonuclease/phosphatase family protein n=1 Tax=Aquibium sp. ELW1220 TaxID=2976766 RepID=UPI0025B265DD|nr:endonuclease/exonuclease/phosphatase family protein [Aquibium sp. ELW1220]MDN2578510.1 endonuclease/exonuclease/phosphatase family protein [Aquibium sp. ELW1220]